MHPTVVPSVQLINVQPVNDRPFPLRQDSRLSSYGVILTCIANHDDSLTVRLGLCEYLSLTIGSTMFYHSDVLLFPQTMLSCWLA